MDSVYDVIIIGGGAAGLTAGIYASRAKLKTLLIESTVHPSQITTTDFIENYPGFPDGIGGFDLIDKFKEQAARFGLESVYGAVQSIQKSPDGWQVSTEDEAYTGLSLIIATGSSYAKLGVPGEEEFIGRGVSYCATCDAPFYKNKEVVVVGGGDASMQEAMYLTKFAHKVTIIHRRDRLRANATLQEKVFANDKISFAWNSVLERISGDASVSGIKLKDVKTGKTSELKADGIFIFAGLNPNTEIFKGLITMNDKGFIQTDSDMQTSQKGIFACGDCIEKILHQVVTACGDGATAAFAAQLYVEELKGVSYDAPEKNK